MSWIETIDYASAGPALRKVYDRVKGADNYIDNVLKVHSLRPHTLSGHMALYKNVLHHADNQLPKWYLEAIGVYVSFMNQCEYCIHHHLTGFGRLYPDIAGTTELMHAIETSTLDRFFDSRFYQGAKYARSLTLDNQNIGHADFLSLRNAGFSDGEILELNQVISYFNYVNRTVNGLGVNLDGDIPGLSPGSNDDPNNWHHE